MMRRLATILAIAALLAGMAIFYQSAALSARSGDDAPLYSTRRYDPYGTAALKDLLAERGVPVRTLERPALEESDRGTLIQVLPLHESSFGRGTRPIQAQRALDWAAQGNTIIQLTRAPTDLMKRCRIAAGDKVPDDDLRSVQEFEARGKPPAEALNIIRAEWSWPDGGEGSPPQREQSLLLWSAMVFADQQPAGWRPIARRSHGPGNVVAGEYRHGQGRIILVGSPTPALNGMLGESGNLDFLLVAIGAGPVIFDEWSLGMGREATVIGFIQRVGLLPVLLQAAFLMALYVWSTSGFPSRDTAAPARQRSSVEQIETLGYLYSQSLSPELAFERVYAEVQRRLADALRCPPQQFRKQLAAAGPRVQQKGHELLDRIDRIGRTRGPRCLGCGYDLTLNVSGCCPECGAAIAPELRQHICESEAMSRLPERSANRRVRLNSDLAAILTLSHQLVQEAERDRRARG